MADASSFPRNDANAFRWMAVPEGAELREVVIHEKWVDLTWVDVTRGVLVYIATRPSHETL